MARLSAFHTPADSMTAARAVEADVYTAATANGVGINLAGKRGALFIVSPGTLGTNATVDAYLQDSADNSTFANVNTTTYPNASITQITVSDGEGQLMEYNAGLKQYCRAVLVVGVATSDAGIACAVY